MAYGIPSLDPFDPRFEGKRYWRGPVWVNVNYMLADGLQYYGYDDLARQLKVNTAELIAKHGMREYYDPKTGEGAGAVEFSWTAALVLSWLGEEDTEPRRSPTAVTPFVAAWSVSSQDLGLTAAPELMDAAAS
eukprot:TRINITY_DN3871_c0_g1_i3.p1 TRINITY_DN3871_c0_g1~~TRINITY_DN3871_c0_g1_i3.p1  ORF type:complete len:148 (-),score=35.95 TRINITY_DN3871_c0_g1_i3:221-619(-)